MDLKVANENDNKIIGRKEIEFYAVQDDRTPSKEEVKQELCKKLNLSPDNTIIVKLDQAFGMKRCHGMAHSYANQEALKKFEKRYLLTRLEKKGAKAAALEKKEEKAEAKAEGAK